ncbi:MAG: hypothetical protein LBR44_01130, partial [Clostridiales Family XIII bacterium]|nr:hypothetical protein [Clostridiales Family XIII bacterium]
NDVLYEAGADETEYVNGPLAAGTTVYYTIAAKYKTHEYAPKGAGGSSDEAVASGGSAKGVGATTTKPAPAYSGGGSGSGSGSGGSGDYITTESSYWVKCNDGTVFNFTEYNEMIVFMSSAECAAHGGFIGNGSWGGGSSTYGHISSGVTDEMLMDLSREAENRAKQEMEGSMPWNW